MNTRPATIAAEDLTGAWVLKDQSNDNDLSRLPGATPRSAGPPRNIGQLAPAEPPAPAEPANNQNIRRPQAHAGASCQRRWRGPAENAGVTFRRIAVGA